MDDKLTVNLDAYEIEVLEGRAHAHGRSTEEEAADILRQQLKKDGGRGYLVEWSRRLRAMTPAGIQQTDSVKLIREDRDR